VRKRIGDSKARLLAIVGGRFNAWQAAQFGILDYVAADDGELNTTIEEVLGKIKVCAPNAVACAKRLMLGQAPSYDPYDLGMLFAQHMASDEGKEGTRAFIEKRKASWNKC